MKKRVGYSQEVEIALLQAQVLLRWIGRKPELAALLSAYGVNQNTLTQGELLCSNLDDAAYRVIQSIKERDRAERSYKELVHALWDEGRRLARLAERSFEGQRGTLYLLGLPRPASGRRRVINPRPRTFRYTTALPWLRNFYGWLGRRPDLAQVLIERGYPAGQLTHNVEQAAGLEELEIRWGQKTALARRARQQRQAAYRTLRVWISRTRRLAVLALRGRRDLQALLGL